MFFKPTSNYLTPFYKSIKGHFGRTYATESKNSGIACGLILTRIPQITREPSQLEKTFWEYSHRKANSVSLPFATEIYFRKGSFNERRWKQLQQSQLEASEKKVELGLEDDVDSSGKKDMFSTEHSANSRITEADIKKDYKSLERSLENHLYLVIKTKNSKGEEVWEFPSGSLKEEETLFQATKREINERLGNNLDYWQVGTSPIGHFVNKAKTTFFMKTIILGGQVEPASPEIVDFVWLNVSELKDYLLPEYYENVKEILSR